MILLRLVFLLLIGYALFLLVKSIIRGSLPRSRRPAGEVETFRDPVCGTFVTRGDAVVGRVAGKTIYFCSQECLEKYLRDSNHTTTQEQ